MFGVDFFVTCAPVCYEAGKAGKLLQLKLTSLWIVSPL